MTHGFWSDFEKNILRDPANREKTGRQMTALLPGRSASAIQHERLELSEREGWRYAGRRILVEPGEEPPVQSDELALLREELNSSREETRELRQITTRLQRTLKRAKQGHDEYVSILYRAAHDAAVIVGGPEIAPPPGDHRQTREEVALLHVTDWQVGKKTSTYDTAVAAERVKLLGTKVLRLTQIERSAHPVRRIVVLAGGDMIENLTIFPGQHWEIDSACFEQVFAAVTMLHGLIVSLASVFEEVEVWTMYGNHGRMGRRGDLPTKDNADLLVYRIAQDRTETAGIPNITWHQPDDWYQIAPIGAYRALLIHGDQIKSSGQTPAFAIQNRSNRWASGVIEPFSDMYMGHFHQPFTLPLARGFGHTYMTPSIESGNEYAKQYVSATGRPAQRLHFIDPDRGRITTQRLIHLDDGLDLGPDV